jgi:hypothetical protein
MQRSLLLLLAVFGIMNLQAQHRPKAPNVASEASAPSATASAYNRENQIPVNHYTGLPQIAVPLHSYEFNGLSHSASLSYFAGGVKVSEPAGNNGIGWSLSAGGAITRTVQGLPDDMPAGGWLYSHNIREYTPYISYFYDPHTGETNEYTNYEHHYPQYYEDSKDAQMDIFQVNAGNLSAKFYLGKDGNIRVAPMQNIKITMTHNFNMGIQGSTIESFTVTDEQGIRYIFNEREVSTLFNSSTGNNNSNSGLYGKAHITGWYLSSVISSFNEDTIRFVYQNTSVGRTLQFPPSHMHPLWGNFTASENRPSGSILVEGKRLREVRFPDKSWLDMHYDTQTRCDMNGENALLEVRVRDTVIRSGYKMDYVYATSRGYTAYNTICNDVNRDHRLMLRTITPFSRQTNMPAYQFEYEDGYKLPSLNSPAQDHWGLFNNQNANTWLVPAFNNGGLSLAGANRNTDTMAARAYSLRSIRFPTGAVTTLEMEANDYFTVRKQEDNRQLNANGYAFETAPFYKLTNELTRFYIQLHSTGGNPEEWGINDFCEMDVTIEGLYQGNWITGTTVPDGNVIRVTASSAANMPTLDLNFPPGTSEIRFMGQVIDINNCLNSGFFEIKVIWNNEFTETDPNAYRAGGLRVKRILDFDGLSPAPASIREYRYRMENGSGSSGFVKSQPRYDYQMRFTANGSTTGNFLVRNGMPVNFQHYTQGSPVGYSRVEEIFGTPERNLGRTVHEFSTYADFQLTPHVLEHPYVPEQVEEWLLGLPKSVKNYDAAGRLKDEELFTWQKHAYTYPTNDSAFRSLRLGVAHEMQWNSTVTNRVYVEKYYRPVTGWVAQTVSKEISYLDDDTTHSTSSTIYDNTYMVPVSSTTTSNKKLGVVKESRQYYPFHYTMNSGPVAWLRNQGWLYPIATETWEQEAGSQQLLETSINNYQWISGSVMRPISQSKLVSTDPVPLATIGAFNPGVINRNTTFINDINQATLFNSKGIPVETQNLLTGQYQSVILDYENHMPVTTVANARHNEIAYTSFESIGNGNWQYNGTSSLEWPRSIMGKRSYQLSLGNITKTGTPGGKNYIVSLWSKNGTVSVSPGTALASQANSATGWTYREFSVPGGSTITVSGNATIDELRLYPEYCSMSTMNLEPFVGVISECGIDNFISYQDYDVMSRPTVQRDKDWNIVQAVQYDQSTATQVNRTPQWQDVTPAVVTCEKIYGNVNHNNGNQLKMQTDGNPFSISYQATRWVSAGGNPGACPIVPDWQPTYNTRCVTVNGVRTGVQEREERDAHPLSPTYTQLRWVNLGVNGNCPPIQYKASIQVRNWSYHFDGWAYNYTGQVFIVITDQDGNPVNAPGFTVNYQKTEEHYGIPYQYNLSEYINNTSEVMIFDGQLSSYYLDWYTGNPVYTIDNTFAILPGSGYTPW